MALDQEALQPVADPHVHNLKWEAGTAVTFEFHVEVRPTITLGRIGKFHLTRRVAKVSDEQVLAQLNELREQKAPWTPVVGEQPKPKDLVHVTITAREDGELKAPQPYELVLGEGRAIPEVEERIMGMRPGETLDATVRFPEDFPEEAKRGQPRDIRLTLHEVKRQQLPELDDAFAREVGDFDTLDALRQAVRRDLEQEAEREADAQVRADLLEQIVQANRVVAPRPLVERALWVYAQAYGIAEDRARQFTQEFRPVAEAQVRRDLVLDWVADHHQLRATEAELDQRVRELAERRGIPAAAARRRARPHRREGVRVPFVAIHRGADVTTNQIYPPYIIERSSRGERTYDIFSRLLMDRIVFLGTQINDEVANIIIAQLLFLDADNPERDIYLYVNSPGGLVSSGMAIYDTMQFLRAPVNTICMGMAASMGSFLLTAGGKGRRSALPHARIMMHQPSGGTQGTASDIEIQAREILYLRGKLNELYAKHTGKPIELIEKDMDRDRFMSAEEAKEYGLIDNVIANLQQIDDGKKK